MAIFIATYLKLHYLQLKLDRYDQKKIYVSIFQQRLVYSNRSQNKNDLKIICSKMISFNYEGFDKLFDKHQLLQKKQFFL